MDVTKLLEALGIKCDGAFAITNRQKQMNESSVALATMISMGFAMALGAL